MEKLAKSVNKLEEGTDWKTNIARGESSCVFVSLVSKNVVPGATVSASPGNFLELQMLQIRPVQSENSRLGHRNLFLSELQEILRHVQIWKSLYYYYTMTKSPINSEI